MDDGGGTESRGMRTNVCAGMALQGLKFSQFQVPLVTQAMFRSGSPRRVETLRDCEKGKFETKKDKIHAKSRIVHVELQQFLGNVRGGGFSRHLRGSFILVSSADSEGVLRQRATFLT